MNFSNVVAQQRQRQLKTLKRFMMGSLVGSCAFHGVGLCLNVPSWTEVHEPIPAEITLVVTDVPVEEVLVEEVPVEEARTEAIAPEPLIEEPFVEPSDATAPPETAWVMDDPIAPEPLSETIPDEPLQVENLLEDPPLDAPPESTPDTPSDPLGVPVDGLETALASSDRPLRELLNDLRQARQSSRSSNLSNPLRGFTPRWGRDPVAPSSSSDPHALGASDLEEPASSAIVPPTEVERDRPPRSSSREITCEGCDFDYPENADGAEGSAQVIVETDDQGRVVGVTLVRSSGNAELDRAALEQALERVRLDGARSGESYPIEIDFVQSGSEAEERARQEGTRDSITVVDSIPEPDVATEPSDSAIPPSDQTPVDENSSPVEINPSEAAVPPLDEENELIPVDVPAETWEETEPVDVPAESLSESPPVVEVESSDFSEPVAPEEPLPMDVPIENWDSPAPEAEVEPSTVSAPVESEMVPAEAPEESIN